MCAGQQYHWCDFRVGGFQVVAQQLSIRAHSVLSCRKPEGIVMGLSLVVYWTFL